VPGAAATVGAGDGSAAEGVLDAALVLGAAPGLAAAGSSASGDRPFVVSLLPALAARWDSWAASGICAECGVAVGASRGAVVVGVAACAVGASRGAVVCIAA
jgi:hypothetical protein